MIGHESGQSGLVGSNVRLFSGNEAFGRHGSGNRTPTLPSASGMLRDPEQRLSFFLGRMIPGEGNESQKRGERAKSASLARFFEFPTKMSDLMTEGQT
jgi:hypothetical protein